MESLTIKHERLYWGQDFDISCSKASRKYMNQCTLNSLSFPCKTTHAVCPSHTGQIWFVHVFQDLVTKELELLMQLSVLVSWVSTSFICFCLAPLELSIGRFPCQSWPLNLPSTWSLVDKVPEGQLINRVFNTESGVCIYLFIEFQLCARPCSKHWT